MFYKVEKYHNEGERYSLKIARAGYTSFLKKFQSVWENLKQKKAELTMQTHTMLLGQVQQGGVQGDPGEPRTTSL